MARLRSVLTLVTLAGLTSACSSFDSSYDKGLVVIGGSQTGLTVRYDPNETKSAQVDQVAINFCKGYDKKPIRRSRSDFLSNVVYQAYDCVTPTAGSVPTPPPAPAPTVESASPEAH